MSPNKSLAQLGLSIDQPVEAKSMLLSEGDVFLQHCFNAVQDLLECPLSRFLSLMIFLQQQFGWKKNVKGEFKVKASL